MRLENGAETARCEELFSPRDEIPPYVEVLTRIKKADLAGKPVFGEKLDALREVIGPDTVIVGQNIAFDIGMLRGEGLDLSDRPRIDTSMLASLAFPEERSFSLGHLSRRLELPHYPVHRAMGDVRATLELFKRCMERLASLPDELLAPAKDILARSTDGYRLLAESLPKGTGESRPTWMACARTCHGCSGEENVSVLPPHDGVVELLQDDLNPALLSCIMHAAAKDKTRHWLAVKNLETMLKVCPMEKGMRVLYPPFLLLDPAAGERLLKQDAFTADEATMAIKLLWHTPTTRAQLPIHGDERAVWNGKLACTDASPTYTKQFDALPSAVLLDHGQLLTMLADDVHASAASFAEGAHVLIDDASMLEDTATKAYGHECSMDDLRAASEGHEQLTHLTNLAHLWIEKRRGEEETHYLTAADMRHEETSQLRALCAELGNDASLPALCREQIAEFAAILASQPDTHILWIERRRSGSDFVHAVPKRISETLREHLYSRHPTTLITPPGPPEHFRSILGEKTEAIRTATEHAESLVIACDAETTSEQILENPPAGKTIILLPSKRVIEMAFVKHTERLEEKGVTLICQGLSGGQNRMEAEFLSAAEPAVWLLTPWTYEGTDLPEGTIDHLVLDTLPFDFPGHPVLGKRADEFQNGFRDYLMPRMVQRVFRLLRTFRRHSKPGADMRVLDKRLWAKEYGKTVMEYLQQFSLQPVARTDGEAPLKTPPTFTKKKVSAPAKPTNTDQQSLF